MKIEIKDIIELLKGYLDSPRLEARLILGHVLGIDSDEVSPMPYELSQIEYERLQGIIKKRLSGFPLDKLLGHKDFYKYSFKVTEDVLSPRPDTEILVEAAGEIIFRENLKKMMDMGVGSGCIILSLLADFPNLEGVGIDASSQALQITKENAERLGVNNRLKLYEKSWFDQDIQNITGQEFDIITSNPPYIASQEIEGLSTEVKAHDPIMALDGGEDGFEHYRQIAKVAPILLKNGGYLFLECGINQDEEVVKIFESSGMKHKKTIADLSGINRCIIMKK